QYSLERECSSESLELSLVFVRNGLWQLFKHATQVRRSWKDYGIGSVKGGIDAARIPDRTNRRLKRSDANLTASNASAAAPRKLFGYAQTETQGRTRSVHISVHGSAEP